jgi:HPt (histidine-containing phosphotransfer) domain-containing protein
MRPEIIDIYSIASVPLKSVFKLLPGKSHMAAYPDKEIIDREAALERAMGDEQFFLELLQKFINDLPDIKESIGEAIGHQHTETVAKNACRLAEASGNLGAVRLSDAAFELEQVCRNGQIGKAPCCFRKLIQEVDRFVGHVRAVEFDSFRCLNVS